MTVITGKGYLVNYEKDPKLLLFYEILGHQERTQLTYPAVRNQKQLFHLQIPVRK